jgi:epoxyqueuosine reductase QueG
VVWVTSTDLSAKHQADQASLPKGLFGGEVFEKFRGRIFPSEVVTGAGSIILFRIRLVEEILRNFH